jgi:methylenetetrahydrofolate reductase (NADPH)
MTVSRLQAAGYRTAPHLCGAGSTREEIGRLLAEYARLNVETIVALRGDMTDEAAGGNEFPHASDLVAFIRATTGDRFRLAVGCYPECHPQACSPGDDLEHLKRKVAMGANWAITQYFYNADAYFRFLEMCGSIGLDVPIVPGVMPIADVPQLLRFSEACGAEIPRWMRMRLQSYEQNPESARQFGLDVVTELCDRLLAGGAPGLHFYTLNRWDLTSTICGRLTLSRSTRPRPPRPRFRARSSILDPFSFDPTI